MYYVFKTPDGRPRVSRTLEEPNLTAIPLELVEETEEDPNFTGHEVWVDGEWITIDPCPPYRRQREEAYPSIEDQLDALWKAMDEGVLPKAGKFYDAIKAVKDKYPKTAQALYPRYASKELDLHE